MTKKRVESTSKGGGSFSKERLKYEIKDKNFSGQKFRSRRDRQSKRGLHDSRKRAEVKRGG